MFYEDGAGFITHHYVMSRFETDKDVVVEQTKIVQARLEDRIERASFDRGFHSPANQLALADIVRHVCLPKPGAKQAIEQQATASPEYLAGVQSHSGIESAIGCLQSGNGLKRCRDKSERGFERYVSLAVLGRNLHRLGRVLIRLAAPSSEASHTQRAA